MSRSTVLLAVLLPLLAPAPVPAEPKRPLTVQDLFRFQRISDPQISPDGKLVVYVVGTVDLPNNTIITNLWLAPTDGGPPRPLTNTTRKDRHPRWSPDGKSILFESTRSGSLQLWVIDVDGGEARPLTNLSTEASNGIWSPDGKHIAFVSAVYPEYSDKPFHESDALNKKKAEAIAQSPVKARVFTRLFYRHWDSYVEDKRQHLFVQPVARQAHGWQTVGHPRDVTPGDRDAYPTSTTFSVGDDFTFSPDGKYLVFTAVPEKDEAWSTNFDLCRVPITGGSKDWECLTQNNPAADGAPQFSPDGKLLAYRAQKRPGYEADEWELMVVPTDASGAWQGQPRSVTDQFDGWPESFVWVPGKDLILFTADHEARVPIFAVHVPSGKVVRVKAGPSHSWLSISQDGGQLAYATASLDSPPEVYLTHFEILEVWAKEGGVKEQTWQLSRANEAVRQELLWALPPENITVPGAGGTPMQMWILKPPGFDPKKKWPLVYLVHGGPQGAWSDNWSYRWNPQLWAAQGYVVALPNPRGSIGFGQKYVDEISGDWGGKCYEDLMAGVAYLEKQPYIDAERLAAAGASFGGYMMNWFQGNTTKFKTLITHCGVYNFESMYATTEELWFDEWEHGGPPWGPNRHSYEKHSPHRLAGNFKTPMLIIHNDLDFRVPVSEGHQLFTTLQRLGVPSKFINFPDEGHWVLKPLNSEYWHKEVFAWLAKYVPPGGK